MPRFMPKSSKLKIIQDDINVASTFVASTILATSSFCRRRWHSAFIAALATLCFLSLPVYAQANNPTVTPPAQSSPSIPPSPSPIPGSQPAGNALSLPSDGSLSILSGVNKVRADELWKTYQSNIGSPMMKWAAAEITVKPGGTVFYPFSGPDFVTVSSLFPDADRYIMVAMQSGGAPAQLASMAAPRQQAFQAKFLREWAKFSRLGFFRTDDLNEDLRDKQAYIGTTTILMTFAHYMGYVVKDVYPIVLDTASGEFVRADQAPWKSVRLMLSKAGRPVTIDYVSVDLSDGHLSQVPPMRDWLNKQAAHPVLLKAASHLLQESYFSILRDMIVANAPMVVQDETGLNYTFLEKIGKVQLYGGFLYPHELFNRNKQASLAQAYKVATDVKPLPFGFSYNKSAERRSIQVVKRAP